MENFLHSVAVNNMFLAASLSEGTLSISVSDHVFGHVGYSWKNVKLKPGMDTLRADGDRGIKFKVKMMKNGELRLAAEVPGEGWYTITIATNWRPGIDPLPVQNSHYHRDEYEFYKVVQGWLVAISLQNGRRWRGQLQNKRTGEFMFEPAQDHNIVPGPGAVFISSKCVTKCPSWNDDERGNLDRKGNNWWPTPPNLWAEAVRHLTSIETLATLTDCDVAELA